MLGQEAYTTQKIASLLGVNSISTVTRRASRESWQSATRTGRGGGKLWISQTERSVKVKRRGSTSPFSVFLCHFARESVPTAPPPYSFCKKFQKMWGRVWGKFAHNEKSTHIFM